MAQDFLPFYVGQRVVAIKDSEELLSMLPYKKGDEFVVSALKQDNTFKAWHMSFISRPTYEYYDCSYFAPIQENFQPISLEKILEEETKLVSAN